MAAGTVCRRRSQISCQCDRGLPECNQMKIQSQIREMGLLRLLFLDYSRLRAYPAMNQNAVALMKQADNLIRERVHFCFISNEIINNRDGQKCQLSWLGSLFVQFDELWTIGNKPCQFILWLQANESIYLCATWGREHEKLMSFLRLGWLAGKIEVRLLFRRIMRTCI